MLKKQTSKIWLTPSFELQNIINKSQSYSDVLRFLGLSNRGSSNHNRLKQRISKDNLNINHFGIKNGHNPITKKYLRKQPACDLNSVLVVKSEYSRAALKKRLIKENIIEYKCQICGLHEWLNKKISLRLDHINGIHDDNRLENLRLLCPNCDSQQDTYAGKNKK